MENNLTDKMLQSNKYRIEIESALKKIDWWLKDAGCGNWRFINQKGEVQPIIFYYDRIQLDESLYTGRFSISFYMKDVEIDVYDGIKGIGFRGKNDRSIFLNCYNFDV